MKSAEYTDISQTFHYSEGVFCKKKKQPKNN